MAFQIITGSYSSPNDIIDGLAEAWDFDDSELSGTNHSIRWGGTVFIQTSGELAIQVNGSIPTGAGIIVGTGSYRIYKTNNALLCDVNNIGAIAITTAHNIADNSDIQYISALASSRSNGQVFIACGNGYYAHNHTNFVVPTSTTAIQVIPYLDAQGGYVADNLFLTRVAESANENCRCYINDDMYYIFKGLAIKS